jgi:hypothetical protein
LLLLAGVLALPAGAAAQHPALTPEWNLHAGGRLSRLRYANASQQTSVDGGTEYRLGRHPLQAGAVLGGAVAVPVPPTGRTTFLVLRSELAYNRRTLAVQATPAGGPPALPAYAARFRYRTVDVQVGLDVRHYLAPRRRLFWEAGPLLALTTQDYSRVDATGKPERVAQGPGSNVLLRAALGLRSPWPGSARWQLSLAYARGMVARRTQVVTSEDYAELLLHYPLSRP